MYIEQKTIETFWMAENYELYICVPNRFRNVTNCFIVTDWSLRAWGGSEPFGLSVFFNKASALVGD